MKSRPRFFDVTKGEAEQVRDTPYGRVGNLYSDRAVEMVWISKHAEQIDPGWFSQATVDLIVVVQGKLKVEFEAAEDPHIMTPGEVLILPPDTRCRAYRWPRHAQIPTVFIAIYPVPDEGRLIRKFPV